MKVDIDLTGIKDIKEALDRKSKINDRLKSVLAKNGGMLQRNAMRYAPVDTGHLKRSITIDIKDNGLTAEVESTAEYAVYQEYGTRYQSGTPHIRPAFNDVKDRFIEDCEKVVRE